MSVEVFGVYVFAGGAAGLVGWSVSTTIMKVLARVDKAAQRMEFFPTKKKLDRTVIDLDRIFMNVQRGQLLLLYLILPVIAGFLLHFLFRHILFIFLGGAVGLILPDMLVRYMKSRYKQRLSNQIVDIIHLIVTSLKAGLSLSQAVEAVSTEMPSPASWEFGLVVKSNKMGLTLDESLLGLKRRMNIEDLSLVLNAVLVAKETGGNVTDVLEQMSNTIREKRKLHEKVNTLTTQGKLQAYLMSVIPVAFAMFIKATNPAYFDTLLRTKMGGTLLILAVVLWIVGVILVVRLSKVDV